MTIRAQGNPHLPPAVVDCIARLDDAVIVTTFDMSSAGPTILLANPAWFRLTGFSEAEAVGASPRILHGPATDHEVLRTLMQSLAADTPFSGMVENYRRDGTQFTMELTVETLRAPFAAPVGFVAVEHAHPCNPPDARAHLEFVARARECLVEVFSALASHAADDPTRDFQNGALEREGRLTRRQREIAALLARGLDVVEVANHLGIAVGTVRNHRNSIYRRLDVHSQTELMARFRVSEPVLPE